MQSEQWHVDDGQVSLDLWVWSTSWRFRLASWVVRLILGKRYQFASNVTAWNRWTPSDLRAGQ